MKERLTNDLKAAMKEQNKELLSVLRMVKGAIQMEEIKVKHELSDDEVIAIIGKQIKTRKESIVEFEKGGRNDLIEKTNEEINMLNVYMPKQLSEEEIKAEIDKVFEELKPASNEMGKIMQALSNLKGKADMGLVSKLVKERF
ncbi:MAG: GatB/YqeY domain-containing protein [Candidatus Faecisoma sp.]|nr:GatB/YqeY domain-containing protein [Acholeplasma sp.]MDY2892452.1 GatB/YqeY domain-containing protein [Candidatus Faecisoma sp.]CCY28330.1 yqeY-like protein [Acholeplasma sp. CAG:878]